jgi:hypothetical protein
VGIAERAEEDFTVVEVHLVVEVVRGSPVGVFGKELERAERPGASIRPGSVFFAGHTLEGRVLLFGFRACRPGSVFMLCCLSVAAFSQEHPAPHLVSGPAQTSHAPQNGTEQEGREVTPQQTWQQQAEHKDPDVFLSHMRREPRVAPRVRCHWIRIRASTAGGWGCGRVPRFGRQLVQRVPRIRDQDRVTH